MALREPGGWGKVIVAGVVTLILTVSTVLISTGSYREKIETTEKNVIELKARDMAHEAELKLLRDLTVKTTALQEQQAKMMEIMLQHIVMEAKNGRSR